MNSKNNPAPIITKEEEILVTGASGFIGRQVVKTLLKMGFVRVKCLIRETSNYSELIRIIKSLNCEDRIKLVVGNLLSKEDCQKITEGVRLIYHLAAGTGTKSFSEAFLNSVVTTRNLIEAVLSHGGLKRFVNVSSFAVYTNMKKPRGRILDETCPVETHPETRAEAYCYGKVKQDQLVIEYGKKANLPYVIVRPGTVYGPGKAFIPGRVGINTFGPFLHLGGTNPLPLTYVENCSEAITLCGLVPGIEGEIFNVVDDDLPSSRFFLRQYKKNVKSFKSLYLPKFMSYLLFLIWEKMSCWSKGQLPPVFTRREWIAYYKNTHYSNEKIKKLLGWKPRVSTEGGLKAFFEYCAQVKGGK